ncbi:MAG: hypothetical protein A2928_01410 [Candidatus Taylorbacteria bacterium RIFCSPLOWO2_01_FULL_45_15b]|uniref:Uncharacterized protein n=1 Tax=Candidatus Taylorbacteria bacterium RIFCSPLOWO2_01_FULL_45_15b TaxID=1802319 RepID=A0A1G2NA42_9BACT|nr:MAG: hypothetical protein A2928_01410 [Candidatus Taylorbacteria bacterium RIFCSPLOWO2_01_FULL_45_15b]
MNYQNQKSNFCKKELKTLLDKLISGNYHVSAETVFHHLAHTGVDTDLDPKLKETPTLEEFLKYK